jgi:molecular chaperone GrpE
MKIKDSFVQESEKDISSADDFLEKEDSEDKSDGDEELKKLEDELKLQKDKYLRLYAEFENYKKRVHKDKEDILSYGNESLLYELLPVIDNLELALKHATAETAGLAQGVEITLKEFLKVIEKFGVVPVAALGEKFNPELHHAMTQVQRDDVNENIIVEEYRKGYKMRDKTLRPSLVAVSKKMEDSKENADDLDSNEIKNNEIENEEEN